ncbi:Integrator complex subunit 3 [Nowakowskiella sp. JEL0407]|nr:Integrator complex subunit 3 [Nowakowskiella sp. JEL0407]
MEMLYIGRELVRALLDISMIPQITNLLRDIIVSPQKLSPHFTGIKQILDLPTPEDIYRCRITTSMEEKLRHILFKLGFDRYQRNLTWFQARYLNEFNSDTLLSDIIRYICGCIHPSNEQLASQLVPRYMVIASLMKNVKSIVGDSHVKLALFYDWINYNQYTNIMNIEPGLLLLYRFVSSRSEITLSLLEFLYSVGNEFLPIHTKDVLKSLDMVMKDGVEKGVIRSLVSVYQHANVTPLHRVIIRKLFPSSINSYLPPSISKPVSQPVVNGITSENPSIQDNTKENLDNTSASTSLTKAVGKIDGFTNGTAADDLPTKSRNSVVVEQKSKELLALERGLQTKQYCAEQLMQIFVKFDSETVGTLNTYFSSVFLFPENFKAKDYDYIKSTFFESLCMIFNEGTESHKENCRQYLLALSSASSPKLLASVLRYSLQNARQDSVKSRLYQTVVRIFQIPDVEQVLTDLRILYEFEFPTFYSLIHYAYKLFPEVLSGNREFFAKLVYTINRSQLFNLVKVVMSERIEIFGSDKSKVIPILNESLSWQPFEQQVVWTLFKTEIRLRVNALLDFMPDVINLVARTDRVSPEAKLGLVEVLLAMQPNPKIVAILEFHHSVAIKEVWSIISNNWKRV